VRGNSGLFSAGVLRARPLGYYCPDSADYLKTPMAEEGYCGLDEL